MTELEQNIANSKREVDEFRDHNPHAELEDKHSGRYKRAIGIMILAVAGYETVRKTADGLLNQRDGFAEVREGVYIPWELATTHDKLIGNFRNIDGKYIFIEESSVEGTVSEHLSPVDCDVYFSLDELFADNASVREKYGEYHWVHIQKKTVADEAGSERRFAVMCLSSEPDALKQLTEYNRQKRRNPESVEPGVHDRLFPHVLGHQAGLEFSIDLHREISTSGE